MQISTFRLAVAALLAATSFGVLGAGTAYAVQAHMASAKDHLRQSLVELQQADPDKGGHREQAINLVQQAIDQVDQGIQYADQNPQPSTSATPQSTQPALPVVPGLPPIPGLTG